MKRNFKILTKILSGLIVLIVLFMIGSYWYVTTEWKKYFTEDEIKSFVKEIDKAPPLSQTFYWIYDKLHNNDRHKSITSIYSHAVWNEILMDNHQHQTSWFVRAAYFFPKKKGMSDYSDFKLAWGLEKFTSPEKCFDFAMNIENQNLMNHDSTLNDIAQVNDTIEILKYLVMIKSPAFYRKNPELINQKVAELRGKLK